MQYKVSAIVSTYKSERFIRGCLEDLIEQTLYQQDQLEIIVIDSNSPENEAEIVKEFQATYPHIIYQRTPERETLYAAWNRAIKLSSGEYITNANTDDRHRPDALEILATHLDKHLTYVLVYADQLITTVPNERWESALTCRHFNWPSYSWERLCKHCIIGPQPMWRHSVHQKYGYFDANYPSAGDYEFWLRIGRKDNIAYVSEILGLYYENPSSLERTSNSTQETERIKIKYGITPYRDQSHHNHISVISISTLFQLPYHNSSLNPILKKEKISFDQTFKFQFFREKFPDRNLRQNHILINLLPDLIKKESIQTLAALIYNEIDKLFHYYSCETTKLWINTNFPLNHENLEKLDFSINEAVIVWIDQADISSAVSALEVYDLIECTGIMNEFDWQLFLLNMNNCNGAK